LGRRGANQTAVILAGAGTLACGLSNSMEMLIAARFVSYVAMIFIQIFIVNFRSLALGVVV
jgi:MFS family permease